MFDLTFLGTAASVPSPERGLSALMVDYGPHRFLIDCGEGTQRQILCAGLGFRRLNRILLTHGHLDHLLGLGGLAGTINLWRSTKRLTIHAGAAPLDLARQLLLDIAWAGARPRGLDIQFEELRPGPFFEQGRLRISAFPVRHAAPDCYGFLFEETPRRTLLTDRLEAFGVPPGPERARLALGEAVRLADGRVIEPESVQAPFIPGPRIAIVGDAESVDDLVEPVRGCDLLVIEATFRTEDEATARERSHLTIADAARLARAAGVTRLWLTHQSGRYRFEDMAEEAHAAFPGARIARDFDRVRVPEPAG